MDNHQIILRVPRAKSNAQFLFIDRHAKSSHLAPSSTHEKSAINSFVQLGRKRHRQSRRLPRKNTLSPDGVGTDEDLALCILKSTPGNFRSILPRLNRRKPHKDAGLVKSRPFLGTSGSQLNKIPIVPDVCYRPDPFETTPIPVDKTIHDLLHYYVHCYHPTIWSNELAARYHGLYAFKNQVDNILTAAMRDRLTMYCLLTAAACRFQYVDRVSSPLLSRQECYYAYKAIQLLRIRMNDDNLQDAGQIHHNLVNIVFLMSAEAYRNNIIASEIHLQAAADLVESTGGIMQLEDTNLQGQLLMGDLYLACVQLKPCLFGHDYDPGAASTLALEEVELYPDNDKSTGNALLVKDDPMVPSALKDLIRQIAQSYSVKYRLKVSSTTPTRVMEIMHWVTKRNMAIRNRLLASKTTDSKVHALITTLIMWTLLSMNTTGRTKTVKDMAPTLKSIMRQIPCRIWGEDSDVRFWILLTGYACASENSQSSDWFLRQCCKVDCFKTASAFCGGKETTVLERLEIFQKSFFYHTDIQRPAMLELIRRSAQLWSTSHGLRSYRASSEALMAQSSCSSLLSKIRN